MSWVNEIREGAYTSPVSKKRIVFQFEDVSLVRPKKTTAFDFVDADGTYMQDNGLRGDQFPLRMYFSGSDYLAQAQLMLDYLSEKGAGYLEHPLYGAYDVVPVGDLARRDDLKTAANQAVFEITFWASIDIIYPLAQDDPSAAVLSAVDRFNAAIANGTASALSLNSAFKKATFKNKYTALLSTVSTTMRNIAAAQASVLATFDTVVASINEGIDVLVDDPLTLAFQTTIAIQAPARAAAAIRARLDGYKNLASDIVNGGSSSNSNDFHTQDLYASSYVSGSILSALNTQFFSKPQAIQAASDILTQLDDVVAWRDANLLALGILDDGGAYQQLQDAAALAAGFLVQISFTLKQERSIVLTSPRNIIDLCAELYGSVDDMLDFFIISNDFSGEEIVEIPRGRRVVYYV